MKKKHEKMKVLKKEKKIVKKEKKIMEKWQKIVKMNSGSVILAVAFWEMSFGICPFR